MERRSFLKNVAIGLLTLHTYKNGVIDPNETLYRDILDVDDLPERIFAGINFPIGLDRPMGEPDEAIMLNNDRLDMFRIDSIEFDAKKTVYVHTLQFIGIPGAFILKSILENNPVFLRDYGTYKGESSSSGHPMRF